MASVEFGQGEKLDPRIGRTRKHVIETARQMLEEATEPLSFTAVADRAYVARQTLYKHWGSIGNLVADAVSLPTPDVSEYSGLDTEEKAAKFLNDLASQLAGGNGAGIATVQAAAAFNSDAKTALAKLNDEIHESFNIAVGKVDRDGYLQLVAPVIYVAIAGSAPTAELVNSLAVRATQLVK